MSCAYINVRVKATPEQLRKYGLKAQHAVAVQAEKDCKPYVPKESGMLRESGSVKASTITWTTPYARVVFFGNVYVDPVYKVGGFPYKQGMFRSRRGVKKVTSGRKFNINNGEPMWFYDVKKKKITEWCKIAGRIISDV